jgi:hypothetical protein
MVPSSFDEISNQVDNILFLLKVLINDKFYFEEVEDFIENEIDTDRLQIITFLQV